MSDPTEFHAPAFFLADHAAVENGKLYVNGGFWNRMNFPSFPAAAAFSVAAVLDVPWAAYNQPHHFAVRFEDADGARMDAEFQGDFEVGVSPEMRVGDPTVMPIAATLGNFVIPRGGDYSAVLEIDGAEVNRWPFRAVQMTPTVEGASGFGPADIPPFRS